MCIRDSYEAIDFQLPDVSYGPAWDTVLDTAARLASAAHLDRPCRPSFLPGPGSGSDVLHLLVLQKIHRQIPLGRPLGAGDVAQPSRRQVQRRLPVGMP